MAQPSRLSMQLALRDFHHARREASIQQLLARLRGESVDLMGFHEVHEKLRPTGTTIHHGVQEIPLDRIVGSVDRYKDFTRTFLPKRQSDDERWAGVKAAVDSMVGMPPIDVYQVGDAYFVRDGNHRVSIARRLDSGHISADVMEIQTRVPLTAADDPTELICKSRYGDFLERTNLDRLRPGADLMMSYCDQYERLLGQIKSRAPADPDADETGAAWERAVGDWYDHVYLPVVQIMRELGVLTRFPGRTEADLYFLLSARKSEIEAELGWNVDLETAISDLLAAPAPRVGLLDRVVGAIVPPSPEPPPGLWRKQQQARRRDHYLFEHILLPLDGTEVGWELLEYTLKAAKQDHDHILGLHVVPNAAAVTSEAVQQMRDRFNKGCREAGVDGELAIEVGTDPVGVILRRSVWVDCLFVSGTRPPDGRPLERLSPELKRLVGGSPRPLQIRPDGTTSDYSRMLLAYDGSPRSDEALYVATYFAGRRRRPLTVVTVQTEHTRAPVLDRALVYLAEHGITDVTPVLERGEVADRVLATARAHDSNVLIMGGFSFRSLRHLRLGSCAERILHDFPDPIWICR